MFYCVSPVPSVLARAGDYQGCAIFHRGTRQEMKPENQKFETPRMSGPSSTGINLAAHGGPAAVSQTWAGPRLRSCLI
ncbi:hypothetical protein ROA7023_01488 [Roseisalinus antarcticus]|uniref:Uncharacterized protein n=1 Tax=Roseisalinus antarcticus TaxID=254357 RepID=A0A1Y5SJ29_9RHOB|nr:hypothetical protein ROA7023_01488 [Roseisalinus antarcticus]